MKKLDALSRPRVISNLGFKLFDICRPGKYRIQSGD
jgi:hypothetical protein